MIDLRLLSAYTSGSLYLDFRVDCVCVCVCMWIGRKDGRLIVCGAIINVLLAFVCLCVCVCSIGASGILILCVFY